MSAATVMGVVPPVPSGTAGGPPAALTLPVWSAKFVGELGAVKVVSVASLGSLLRDVTPSVGSAPDAKISVS